MKQAASSLGLHVETVNNQKIENHQLSKETKSTFYVMKTTYIFKPQKAVIYTILTIPETTGMPKSNNQKNTT